MCLSLDNQLEIFKVINSHESLLKKLIKREKKAALKRTHSEMQDPDDSLPIKKTVDKAKLLKSIEDRSYDFTLHFAKKIAVPVAE